MQDDLADETASMVMHAYDAQLFGFNPAAFTHYLHNVLMTHVDGCIEEVERRVRIESSLSENVTEEEIQRGTENLKDKFHEAIDYNVGKIELFLMKNILRVSDHLILPEDKVQETHKCTSEEEDKVDEELEELKRKIKVNYYVRGLLENELTELNSAQQQADKMLEEIKDLSETASTLQVENVEKTLQNSANFIEVFELVRQMKTCLVTPAQKTKPKPWSKRKRKISR